MQSFLARLTFVCLVLVCSLTAIAQTATAPISGSVADQNGAVISGAIVLVKNDATIPIDSIANPTNQ